MKDSKEAGFSPLCAAKAEWCNDARGGPGRSKRRVPQANITAANANSDLLGARLTASLMWVWQNRGDKASDGVVNKKRVGQVVVQPAGFSALQGM